LYKKVSKSSVLEEADMQPMTPVMNLVLEGLKGKSLVRPSPLLRPEQCPVPYPGPCCGEKGAW